jgi:hypothetical protein
MVVGLLRPGVRGGHSPIVTGASGQSNPCGAHESETSRRSGPRDRRIRRVLERETPECS